MQVIAHKNPMLILALSVACLAALAATSKKPAKQWKPTESVVREYDKFITSGALLTPEGWKRSSSLFNTSDPYPQNGEIVVEDISELMAEDWVKGDHAQVETKWDDLYGRIDSSLRYKSQFPGGAPMTAARLITLVCVPSTAVNTEMSDPRCAGEWKLEGPQRVRSATRLAAIKYVMEMRDKSTDPKIRKNADKTIEILKRLGRHSPACAC
jgi:hypothetical protein